MEDGSRTYPSQLRKVSFTIWKTLSKNLHSEKHRKRHGLVLEINERFSKITYILKPFLL
jgi:hypothetical protein